MATWEEHRPGLHGGGGREVREGAQRSEPERGGGKPRMGPRARILAGGSSQTVTGSCLEEH